MGSYSREQSLTSGFPYSRTEINTKVSQFRIKTHPQFVELRHFDGPWELRQHRTFINVCGSQFILVLIEVVRNIPLERQNLVKRS